jgi:hypothetical protein
VVYAKPPFAGPEAVLAYLSRYPPCRHLEPEFDAFDETGVRRLLGIESNNQP